MSGRYSGRLLTTHWWVPRDDVQRATVVFRVSVTQEKVILVFLVCFTEEICLQSTHCLTLVVRSLLTFSSEVLSAVVGTVIHRVSF